LPRRHREQTFANSTKSTWAAKIRGRIAQVSLSFLGRTDHNSSGARNGVPEREQIMEPTAQQVEVKPIPPAPRRSWRWKVAGALGVLTALALWRLSARLAVADVVAPRSGPVALRDESLGDFELMVFARQALQHDDQLGALNLGVTVRGRVATLWGGIPSEELARRAEERLRHTTGIMAVHNELRVEPRREAKKNLFARPASPFGGDTEQAGSLLAPGSLTSLPGERVGISRSSFTPATEEGNPPEAMTVTPPLVITLRPPIPEPPPLEDRKTTPVAAADLMAALERVRARESRFRQIRLDVQDGRVRLSGTVPQAGDMMAFAQLIAKVPGVKHVIVGETRTPERGALQLP
jgi:hypothetical protein